MKKLISLFLAVLMLTAFIPVMGASAKTQPVRLYGNTRFETSQAICQEGWPTSSTNAIVVSGLYYPDALAAVPLAKKLNAPILLTMGYTTIIDDHVLSELQRIHAANIIVVGGSGVINESVSATYWLAPGIVTRYYGKDRYATSAAVAKHMGNYDTAVIVTGTNYADALSIGPYAAMKGWPILYCNPKTGFTDEVRECIEGKNLVVIGGEGAVPDKFLPRGYTRVYGSDRYETSYKIVKKYESEFGNNVVLATGTNFPDALAGGAFAAKIAAPMLLTNKTAMNPSMKSWFRAKNPAKMYILGGTGTVSEQLVNNILN